MQNLTKEWKQLPVVILEQANFYNIFILCLWIRIIRRSDQGVKFMNFSISFYIAAASYCYYEKVRRPIGTAIVSYLLKYCYSFSAAELNNNESDYGDSDDEDTNNCISGRLNNNYFPLNENSSLY